MLRPVYLMLVVLALALPVATLAQQVQTAESDRWTDEPYTERYTTMIFVVHPVLAREFQSFYGTRYTDMTCESCHGKDAEAERWKMPSAHLDALEPAALPEPGSSLETDFMYELVTPLLSRLMGMPMQTAQHPKGVSCFSCHQEKAQ